MPAGDIFGGEVCIFALFGGKRRIIEQNYANSFGRRQERGAPNLLNSHEIAYFFIFGEMRLYLRKI